MLTWHQSMFYRMIDDDTLYDYVRCGFMYGKDKIGKFTKKEVKTIFNFIGEQNPKLFNNFYELTVSKLLGGAP